MPRLRSNSRALRRAAIALSVCLGLAGCGWQTVSREAVRHHSIAISGADQSLRQALQSLTGVRMVKDADISILILDDNEDAGDWTLGSDGRPGTRELVRRITFQLQGRNGQASPKYQTSSRRLLPYDAAKPQADAEARRELEREMAAELADGVLYQLLRFSLPGN